MRFILDEVADKKDTGCKAQRIAVAADRNVIIVFDDGSCIDITEHVDFGNQADPAKLAAFAKIVAACGFAETQAAFRVMKDRWWNTYVGDIWPAPPQWTP